MMASTDITLSFGATSYPVTVGSVTTAQLVTGADGVAVELQKTATHVQWRYVGGAWVDLIALADITGADGKEVELQKTATHIQWRLTGGDWADLVALADITGPTGADSDPLPVGTTIRASQSPGARWKACDGSALAQATYPLLYAQMGLMNDFAGWETAGNAGGTAGCLRIVHGGGTWIAHYASASLFRSVDAGATWTQVFSGNVRYYALGKIGSRWVALWTASNQANAALYSDDDGLTWTSTTPPFVNKEAYGVDSNTAGTLAVMGALGGGMATSVNGVTWIDVTNGAFTTNIYAIRFSRVSGLFVRCGLGGHIATSPDGVTWTTRTSPTTTLLYDIAEASETGVLMAGGTNTNGVIYSINGGISWRYLQLSVANFSIGGICSDGRNFYLQDTSNGFVYMIAEDFSARAILPYGTISGAAIAFGQSRLIVAGSATNRLARATYGYNAATHFRLPKPGLDAGIYTDTYILGD